ncbi:hypothetical protein [Anabaena sp. 90]|nr:hypothetical protein [Anabaena sp. 90]
MSVVKEQGGQRKKFLPITHYLLPITHYPLPITHSLVNLNTCW